ncbi:hypothetical protein ONZ43_g7351 [Nemania bipapillata]|uniref:Uncharacterized protein n=1 Tax=Nemania bipapillata TaxID=110536 RepID=A0ACC2HRE1_9PEZI|nr:hypothetical protein ONZ43_g7351 [Nemania bipapillata]
MNTPWNDDRALCDSIYETFYPTKLAPSFAFTGENFDNEMAPEHESAISRAHESASIQSRLTHDMTAANLKRLTNIQICWIEALNMNLEYDSESRVLAVFDQYKWLIDTTNMVKKWQQQQTEQRQGTEGNALPGTRNL